MNVKHTAASAGPEDMEPMTMGALRQFVQALEGKVADDVEVHAVQRDKGTQRDPWWVTVGLRVEWSD